MEYIKQLIFTLGVHIYVVQPLSLIWWYMAIGLAVWTILADVFLSSGHAKLWRRINFWIAAAYMVLLLYMTVASRSETPHGGVLLRPFYSFYLAREENREYYREMLMNVFLFFPLGLTLPFGLSGRKLPILRAVGIGVILSVCIETLQYAYTLGWTETDDVIMNTLGVLIGSAACAITGAIKRQKKKEGPGDMG